MADSLYEDIWGESEKAQKPTLDLRPDPEDWSTRDPAYAPNGGLKPGASLEDEFVGIRKIVEMAQQTSKRLETLISLGEALRREIDEVGDRVNRFNKQWESWVDKDWGDAHESLKVRISLLEERLLSFANLKLKPK